MLWATVIDWAIFCWMKSHYSHIKTLAASEHYVSRCQLHCKESCPLSWDLLNAKSDGLSPNCRILWWNNNLPSVFSHIQYNMFFEARTWQKKLFVEWPGGQRVLSPPCICTSNFVQKHDFNDHIMTYDAQVQPWRELMFLRFISIWNEMRPGRMPGKRGNRTFHDMGVSSYRFFWGVSHASWQERKKCWLEGKKIL